MKLVAGYRTRGFGWFRIGGYGFAWTDDRHHRALFSVRNRIGPWWDHIHVGHWWFSILGPDRIKPRP